jgi:hypothetical protein
MAEVTLRIGLDESPQGGAPAQLMSSAEASHAA